MADELTTERRPARGLPRITIILFTFTCGLIVLLGMKQYADIVGPLVLTINLFVAAYPIQTWLVRRHVPNVIAQVVLGITVLLILGVFFYALVWSITALIQELPQYQGQLQLLFADLQKFAVDNGISETWMLDQLRAINLSSFTGVLQSTLSQLGNAVAIIVVLVTIIFMMAIDSGSFGTRNAALHHLQPRIWEAMSDYVIGVRRYWVVSSAFGLIVAVIDVVALILLDVPLPIVWGVLAFLTNYIPNVGFLIGLVPPALMALLANDPLNALLVVIIYSAVNFVIQSIIQPKFNGDAVGVTSTVAVLSLLLWSSVIGALGALLALPMTLLAKALLIDPDPSVRWLNTFISNDPKALLDEDPGDHRDETIAVILGEKAPPPLPPEVLQAALDVPKPARPDALL